MRSLRAFLVVLLVQALFVSDVSGQLLSAGVKGGPSWSNIGGPDAGDFDTRMGLSLGGFAVFGLGEVVAIQPEVLYTPKGGRAEPLEGTGGVRLNYVDLPLLFNFTHPGMGTPNLRPHLLVGPTVGFRLGCEVEAELNEESTTLDCDDPLFGGELSTKSTDWGVLFGGGIQFGFGGAVLVLDGRYNLGLVSFDNSPADQDVRNRAFAVMIGIGFRPGR